MSWYTSKVTLTRHSGPDRKATSPPWPRATWRALASPSPDPGDVGPLQQWLEYLFFECVGYAHSFVGDLNYNLLAAVTRFVTDRDTHRPAGAMVFAGR